MKKTLKNLIGLMLVGSSGTYRIGIYQASAKNSNNSGDPISLTYCIT